MRCFPRGRGYQFQSTPSAWRETLRECTPDRHHAISIHSLRMEGDLTESRHKHRHTISIHSLRMEGDWNGSSTLIPARNFNPLPPHGGRQDHTRCLSGGIPISIHSLRMEGDPPSKELMRLLLDFNPLPPHGGRRRTALTCGRCAIFQSTPSAWRETVYSLTIAEHIAISIHSLRMEGDQIDFTYPEIVMVFQSTPSAWRETYEEICYNRPCLDFNPLPPHGGRLFVTVHILLFQQISIHSLRMEGDRAKRWGTAPASEFQSTPSAWRETVFICRCRIIV